MNERDERIKEIERGQELPRAPISYSEDIRWLIAELRSVQRALVEIADFCANEAMAPHASAKPYRSLMEARNRCLVAARADAPAGSTERTPETQRIIDDLYGVFDRLAALADRGAVPSRETSEPAEVNDEEYLREPACATCGAVVTRQVGGGYECQGPDRHLYEPIGGRREPAGPETQT